MLGWWVTAKPSERVILSSTPEIVCARFNPPACHVPLGSVVGGAPIVWLEPPTIAATAPVEFQSALADKPEHSVSWIDENGATIKVYPKSKCVQHTTYFQCGEEVYPPFTFTSDDGHIYKTIPVPNEELCPSMSRNPDGVKWCIY